MLISIIRYSYLGSARMDGWCGSVVTVVLYRSPLRYRSLGSFVLNFSCGGAVTSMVGSIIGLSGDTYIRYGGGYNISCGIQVVYRCLIRIGLFFFLLSFLLL